MAQRHRISLRVTAQGFDGDGWVVTVSKNGAKVVEDIRVQDPLSLDEATLCRWYLEKYVQLSPFSVDRAADAEELLAKYPHELLRQIPLQKLVLTELEAGAYSTDRVVLAIEVCREEDDDADNNIHRLLWETLESPGLWSHRSWEVVVTRSIWPGSRPTLAPVRSYVDEEGTETFNVLLVVARDLSINPSTHEDVDPFLAIDILLNIQARFQNSLTKTARLKVELVRPGTWNAFKRHLQRSERLHGPGYFHIVHFDMHGSMRLVSRAGRKVKAGVLRFGREDSDGTCPVLGSEVAKQLGKYKVPLVILNACESASSFYGDEANVALQLMRRGVRAVVGMPFKITNSAARLFLDTFYQALLLGGMSVSASAALARKTLRSSPIRPARYVLERHVKDDFVVVSYGCDAEDLFLADPGLNRQSYFVPCKRTNGDSCDDYSAVIDKSVCGREFDLLRLEKLLVRGQIVYLTGMCGAGKTTFLKYATSIWKSSRFVDAVVFIDFAFAGELSADEFLGSIIRQLRADLNEEQKHLCVRPERHIQPYDNATLHRTILQTLSSIRAIIIIEGLEHAPVQPFPCSIYSTEAIKTVPYIRSLLETALASSGTGDTKLIFTQRRSDPRSLERLVGHTFGPHRYTLRGLSLADSLELVSGQLLDNSDTHKWTYEDTNWLDGVLDLLQGNPSAILSVIPLQRLLGLSWRQFFIRLHGGISNSLNDMEWSDIRHTAVFDEIRNLSMTWKRSHFFKLCLLSNYWHETVGLELLPFMFHTVATADLKTDFSHGQSDPAQFWAGCFGACVLDRGYVQPGVDNVLEVHPLFTIIGRPYLSSFISLSNRVWMKTAFSSSLALFALRLSESHVAPRLDGANVLTTLDFCLFEVTVDEWPLAVFATFADLDNSHLPRKMQAVLRQKYLDLLKLIPHKLPQAENKMGLWRFLSTSLLSLVFRGGGDGIDAKWWEQTLALATTGTSRIPSLIAGDPDDASVLCRSQFELAAVMSLALLKRIDESRARWQELKAVKGQLGIEDILKSGEDPGLCEASGDDGLFLHRFAVAFTIFEHLEHLLDPDDEVKAVTKYGMLEDQINDIFAEYAGDSAQVGPQDVDLADFQQSIFFSREMIPSREALASDQSRVPPGTFGQDLEAGNWEDACASHLRMARDALASNQFQEALGHVESMGAILRKASAPESTAAAVERCRKRIFTRHLVYMYDVSLFPGRFGETVRTIPCPSLSQAQTNELMRGMLERLVAEERKTEGSLRGWWLRWSALLEQAAAWVELIYDSRGHYEEEAQIMDECAAAVGTKNFTAGLTLLDRLQALCDRGVFSAHPVELSPLQALRDGIEISLEHSTLMDRLTRIWKIDVVESMEIIDKLDAMPSLNRGLTRLSDKTLQGLRHSVSKFRLIAMQEGLESTTWGSLLDRNQSLKRLLGEGYFSHLDQGHVLDVRLLVLDILIKRAIEEERWMEGISFCDEFIQITQDIRAQHPRVHDTCLQMRSRCQEAIAWDRLREAEAAADPATCISIVDELSGMAAHQLSTRGMHRTEFFFFVGPNAERFMRQAYEDACISCARWVRTLGDDKSPCMGIPEDMSDDEYERNFDPPHPRRPTVTWDWITQSRRLLSDKPLRRVRGVGRIRRRTAWACRRLVKYQHEFDIEDEEEEEGWRSSLHDREQFRRPFGCRCHCKGLYCFSD